MIAPPRGYRSREYAEALPHIGIPVELADAGAFLIRRTAPFGASDLVAPYPLLRCDDWQALGVTLDEWTSPDVTATAVTDPFCDPGAESLAHVFGDVVRAWKLHHIVDLREPLASMSRHHRRELRRATVTVETAQPATAATQALVELYAELGRRHSIRGYAAFSAASLVAQLEVPGAQAWLARVDGDVVGVTVAYVDGDCAWYHLSASAEGAKRTNAGYAMVAAMLVDLSEAGVRQVDLGAGAGTSGGTSGLDAFKRGWATHQLPTHLVGRVLDEERNRDLVRRCGADLDSGWFPAYRSGSTT